MQGTAVIEDDAGNAMLQLEGIELVYPTATEDSSQLVIAATFTADPIAETIRFWSHELDAPLACEIAPYNQIAQQLLDPNAAFAKNKSGANVVLIRYADWLRDNSQPALAVNSTRRDELLSGRASYKINSDMEIAHLHDYETAYVYQEIFSDRCYVKHGISLDDCKCIVDVGANIGLFSLFALQQCPEARIYAFEPSPKAFDALSTNAEIYGDGRLKPFNCGISDKEETAVFTFYENSSVFSTFHADHDDDESAVAAVVANMVRASLGPDAPEARVNELVDQLMSDRMSSQTLDCPLKPLSTIFADERIEQICLLKLDAEKSELRILRGIANDDWAKIRQVVIEVHDKIGDVIAEVERLLSDRGFEVAIEEEELLKGSGLYNVFGVRPEQANSAAKNQSNSRSNGAAVQEIVDQRCSELAAQIQTAATQQEAPMLVVNCPSPEVPGLSTAATDSHLEEQLTGCPGVTFFSGSDIANRYSVAEVHDSAADSLGHVPYTADLFAALGTTITRLWHTTTSPPKKVIVLDCDNTLWQGVCGEVGPAALVIDEPRRRLQEFMVEQTRAGRLLCVCSKNELADVEAVFDGRTDMPLTREHIVGWKVNWTAKSQNIRELANELNLGLDSFVFVDDNPVEIAEVAANCPEVATIQIPENSAEIPALLEHVWEFDSASATDEDQQRTRMYQDQVARDRSRDQAPTLQDFIDSLELRIAIDPMDEADIRRVAQLTQRTNQFNVSTIRQTESEVQQISSSDADVWTVRVADRFGDYGLVGVVICRAKQPSQLSIDSFMLSCRVLGRGVEHEVLAHLGRVALERSLEELVIEYQPSERNQPAFDFLQSLDSVGATSEDHGDGTLFRIAATAAADVRYRPQSQPMANQTEPGATAARNVPSRQAFKASQWRTAADIRQAASETQVRARPVSLHPLVPPTDDTESKIAQVWQEVLRVDPVGVTDSFKQLGGTSLIAVQLIARMQEQLGRELSIVSIYEYPTIRQFAAHLTGESSSHQESSDAAKERAQRRREARGRRRTRK